MGLPPSVSLWLLFVVLIRHGVKLSQNLTIDLFGN